MHEQTFGRYRLLDRIEVGGMAEVFRGIQSGAAGFERVVAIKRILPHIAAEPDIIRMFVEEAKLAVQLSHPNIAQIFDLGEVDGSYFIAMEYVDGQSLKAIWERWAERGKRLPAEAIAFLLTQIADALHYAHFAEDPLGRALGIIHRDVSPHNILVSFGGEVKVIDFGLAKATNRVSETRDGVVKGKLAYLSPEQAHGRPIDRRSDIFSLGICAWEMCTGQRAFRRDDDRETVLAIRRGELDPPSRHCVIPQALERIILRALAPDVNLRYRTALELREDVERFARTMEDFDRRNLATLMRTTFPERFPEEPIADGAFALVQKKRKSELPPPDPATLEVAQAELDTGDDEAPDFEDTTEPRARAHDPRDAEDTEPGIVLPEERDGE